MFQIIARMPLDEKWLQRDADIELAAERRSDHSGTNGATSRNGERWHIWEEYTFEDAHLLKQRIDGIDGVKAVMREK